MWTYLAVVPDEEVLWLDVPVNDVLRMTVAQRVSDFLHIVSRTAFTSNNSTQKRVCGYSRTIGR